MAFNDAKEFILLDFRSASESKKRKLIGATFSGVLWPSHLQISGKVAYNGSISMLQPRTGSRVNASTWQNLYLQMMTVEILPVDKFEVD